MNHTHRNEFILSTTSLGLHSSNWCTIYVDSYKSLSRFQVWSRRYIDFYFLLYPYKKEHKRITRAKKEVFFSFSLFPLLKFFVIFGQSRRRNGTRWNDRNRAKKERKKDKKKRNGTISSGEDRVSIHHIHLHF